MLEDSVYDTDPNDIVYAFYSSECIGMEHISFDNNANTSEVYLTVYGNDPMNGKRIRFQLWRASTGKVYDLSASRTVTFTHGAVYGCGNGEPVLLTVNGSERQTINLNPGWNWTSFYINLTPSTGQISKILTANDPWTEGDIIKNPASRNFVTWSDSLNAFVGQFSYLRYIYTYMIYCQKGNTMQISGNLLDENDMTVNVNGNGAWSAMPCLLKQVTPLTEALADYYDDATPGDMIKSHDNFAYFSENKKWTGNLTVMRPGEGYFFRRLAPGNVNIRFFNPTASAPKRVTGYGLQATGFSNPNAATNMTMIAKVEGVQVTGDRLRVFVNDELAAVTSPLDSLYFLTIQSDKTGELKFEIDGKTYVPESGVVNYAADAHYGTLKAPIILRPADGTGVYKIIENQHVVIIRNNEKYDVTGKKLK